MSILPSSSKFSVREKLVVGLIVSFLQVYLFVTRHRKKLFFLGIPTCVISYYVWKLWVNVIRPMRQLLRSMETGDMNLDFGDIPGLGTHSVNLDSSNSTTRTLTDAAMAVGKDGSGGVNKNQPLLEKGSEDEQIMSMFKSMMGGGGGDSGMEGGGNGPTMSDSALTEMVNDPLMKMLMGGLSGGDIGAGSNIPDTSQIALQKRREEERQIFTERQAVSDAHARENLELMKSELSLCWAAIPELSADLKKTPKSDPKGRAVGFHRLQGLVLAKLVSAIVGLQFLLLLSRVVVNIIVRLKIEEKNAEEELEKAKQLENERQKNANDTHIIRPNSKGYHSKHSSKTSMVSTKHTTSTAGSPGGSRAESPGGNRGTSGFSTTGKREIGTVLVSKRWDVDQVLKKAGMANSTKVSSDQTVAGAYDYAGYTGSKNLKNKAKGFFGWIKDKIIGEKTEKKDTKNTTNGNDGEDWANEFLDQQQKSGNTDVQIHHLSDAAIGEFLTQTICMQKQPCLERISRVVEAKVSTSYQNWVEKLESSENLTLGIDVADTRNLCKEIRKEMNLVIKSRGSDAANGGVQHGGSVANGVAVSRETDTETQAKQAERETVQTVQEFDQTFLPSADMLVNQSSLSPEYGTSTVFYSKLLLSEEALMDCKKRELDCNKPEENLAFEVDGNESNVADGIQSNEIQTEIPLSNLVAELFDVVESPHFFAAAIESVSVGIDVLETCFEKYIEKNGKRRPKNTTMINGTTSESTDKEIGNATGNGVVNAIDRAAGNTGNNREIGVTNGTSSKGEDKNGVPMEVVEETQTIPVGKIIPFMVDHTEKIFSEESAVNNAYVTAFSENKNVIAFCEAVAGIS